MRLQQPSSMAFMNNAKTVSSSKNAHSAWQRFQENQLILYTMIFLNPVLVLHSINGIISLLRPDINRNPMFSTFVQPHLDVHERDGLCQLFTVLIVTLQSALYSPQASKITIPISMDEDDTSEDAGD